MKHTINKATLEIMIEMVKKEYPDIEWDESTATYLGGRGMALWGWQDNGIYSVALGLKKSQDELDQMLSIAKKYRITISDNEQKALLEGWLINVVSEDDLPAIKPPKYFLKKRTQYTLESKRSLKEAEKRLSFLSELDYIHTDPNNEGIIKSSEQREHGMTLIRTTKGNYLIPTESYNPADAILGRQSLKSLLEDGVKLIKTIER